MADWRWGREFTAAEIEAERHRLLELDRSYPDLEAEMTVERGWTRDGHEEVIGVEPAGPPADGGLFERAKEALIAFEFSDPEIVAGHYDPDAPLEGRTMVLEIQPPFGLRYLAGVRVAAIRSTADELRTVFGYRYDTLAGHIEHGSEWFLLEKDHASGTVLFRIEAVWKAGEFPNWWSRIGFHVLAPWYRRRWREEAARRLAALGGTIVGAEERNPREWRDDEGDG